MTTPTPPKAEQRKRAQEVFDGMMSYDLIGVLDIPQPVLEALDYAANYFGDIAMGRQYDPEPLVDAFPFLLSTHTQELRKLIEGRKIDIEAYRQDLIKYNRCNRTNRRLNLKEKRSYNQALDDLLTALPLLDNKEI